MDEEGSRLTPQELNALAKTMDWLWYNNDGLSECDRLDSVIAAVAKLARSLATAKHD